MPPGRFFFPNRSIVSQGRCLKQAALWTRRGHGVHLRYMASSFGSSGMGGGMGGGMHSAGRPSRGAGRALVADLTAKRPKPKLKKVLPEVWKLAKPRRWLLAGCFVLMVVNRMCALVLPYSSRPLIDLVFTKHRMGLLPYIVGAVLAATLIQGLTSYALTQLLSTEGQRLIAELRMQVQAHIGRLSVAFYDENRTGPLVARIMTDVEGVRNLIGTGVVDFVGGVLTALLAFSYLLYVSVSMTLWRSVIMTRIRAGAAEGIQDDPAHLPRARPRSTPR